MNNLDQDLPLDHGEAYPLFLDCSLWKTGCLRLMHPEQKRVLQSMTPEKKLEITLRLYRCAKELNAAGLRVQNPDWSQEKIQDKVFS